MALQGKQKYFRLMNSVNLFPAKGVVDICKTLRQDEMYSRSSFGLRSSRQLIEGS
jgi:hypothetical protein